MWTCTNCNTSNSGGNFCYKCGARKPDMNNSGRNYPNTYSSAPDVKKKNTALIAICIILVVISLVSISVAAFVIIGEKTKDNILYSQNDTSSVENKDSKNIENDDKNTTDSDADKIDDTKEGTSSNSKPESDSSIGSSGYNIYTNNDYGFYCAYPAEFMSVLPDGINALKTYISEDLSAVMTIRASRNTNGITVNDAYNDLYTTYGEKITYKAKGSTWYAASIDLGERALYRKLFIINENVYCMDFETNKEDVDKYSPYIEYIEDNFKPF